MAQRRKIESLLAADEVLYRKNTQIEEKCASLLIQDRENELGPREPYYPVESTRIVVAGKELKLSYTV